MNAEIVAKIWKRTGATEMTRPLLLEMFAQARAGFDSFAGFDAPLLPPDPLDALQVNLLRWQARNFGIPKPCEIACGISEELGELTIALSQTHLPETVDAIGDVMIYASQLASARRLSFGWAIDTAVSSAVLFHDVPRSHLGSIANGYLSHVQLKAEQAIRGMDNVEECRLGTFVGLVMLVRFLEPVAAACQSNPIDIWKAVSERVLARDWTANRATGGDG